MSWVHRARSRAVGVYVAAGLSLIWSSAQLAEAGVFPPRFVAGGEDVEFGDLDGDGLVDVVVADADSYTVLRAVGKGERVPVFAASLGRCCSIHIALADMNSDGVLDLVAGNRQPPFLTTLHLGRGDGTFGVAIPIENAVEASAGALADFDGDGIVDLAITNQYRETASVLLGRGDGTFGEPEVVATGPGPGYIVAADFDANGAPDLAMATSGGVTVALGRGDGTFSPSIDLLPGVWVVSIATLDADGDGVLDLATAARFDGRVDVMRGLGDGRFEPFGEPIPLPWAGSVVTGDFDSNGTDDIAAAAVTWGGAVRVWLGRGDGRFAEPIVAATASGLDHLHSVDFDHDGRPDLVGGVVFEDGTDVLVGRGDGQFLSAGMHVVVRHAGLLAAIDVTGDALPDVLSSSYNDTDLQVRVGDGRAGFEEPVVSQLSSFLRGPAVVGDVDGDGSLDLIARRGVPRDVVVLHGHGDGRFDEGWSWPDPRLIGDVIDLADMDGDGDLDLIAVGSGFPLAVLEGFGDGTFAQIPDNVSLSFNPAATMVVDADDDGILDLVTVNGRAHYSRIPGVSILPGRGDRKFGAPIELPSYLDLLTIDAADVDGNGLLDFVAGSKSGLFELYLAEPDGSYSASTLDPGTPSTAIPRFTDLDLDGVTDLFVTWVREENVWLLRGRGDGSFEPAEAYRALDELTGAVFADVDGNGSTDVLLTRRTLSLETMHDVFVLQNVSRLRATIEVVPRVLPWRMLEMGRATIHVTIRGSAAIDPDEIDLDSLTFGPAGATPRFIVPRRPRDLDGDGFADVTAFFRLDETGIEPGDFEACLSGRLTTGAEFEGCAPIVTWPICGLGYELVWVLPFVLWMKRRLGWHRSSPTTISTR